MAVTIGSAGITFNDATVQSTAGIILDTSSSTETTDYRLGVTILIYHGAPVTINQANTVYALSGRQYFSLSNAAGAIQLNGTWRSRGTSIALLTPATDGDDKGTPGTPAEYAYALMYQRVA